VKFMLITSHFISNYTYINACKLISESIYGEVNICDQLNWIPYEEQVDLALSGAVG